MQKLKGEIREKKHQMRILEQRMIGSVETSPYGTSIVEMSQVSLSWNEDKSIHKPLIWKIKSPIFDEVCVDP